MTTSFDCPATDELESDESWWKIYRDSFPASEREPASVILGALRSGIGIAFRARQEQFTVGIATTHLLLEPPAVFLVYLAVERTHRDKGLGAALLDFTERTSLAALRARGLDPLGMIWEVARKGTPGGRRMSFFERHGGVPLSGSYVQPPLNEGAPVPMQLLFRPQRQLPDQKATDALARAMYFEKYGAVNHIPSDTLTALLARRTIRRTYTKEHPAKEHP